MSRQVKRTLLGLVLGILGNLLGFILYGWLVSLSQGVTFQRFIREFVEGPDVFKSKVFTGALLVNVGLFYLFTKRADDSISRGILVSILLTLIVIIYFYA